jgi:intraflagellar transport protein 88
MKNSINDELYDGFDGKQMVYDYDVGQDEAYQNALKISSYGKRSTPKTFTVGIYHAIDC